MKSLVTLVLFLVTLVQASRLCAEDTLSLATLEWPPYVGSSLPQQGYVASLVRAACQRSGISVQLHFMPWARVVAMVKNAKFDGYLPEYYNPSLHDEYFVSDPFPGGPLGFFKRTADPIDWRTLDDLKPYRIGVVRGYLNTEEFDRAAFLVKELATDDLTNLRKLLAKRLDLAVMDKHVGLHLLRTELAGRQEEISFMSHVLEEKSLHLCLLKNSTHGQVMIEAFNQGLKALKEDGSLERLLQANGF